MYLVSQQSQYICPSVKSLLLQVIPLYMFCFCFDVNRSMIYRNKQARWNMKLLFNLLCGDSNKDNGSFFQIWQQCCSRIQNLDHLHVSLHRYAFISVLPKLRIKQNTFLFQKQNYLDWKLNIFSTLVMAKHLHIAVSLLEDSRKLTYESDEQFFLLPVLLSNLRLCHLRVTA